MSVAGSDTHGGAVSGSLVSEKAELVPIKKRRFLYRSCAPCTISSPQNEKRPRAGEETDCQDQPVILLSAPSVSKLNDDDNLQKDACYKNPKNVNESVQCNDDCLSLLADAACGTSLPMHIDNPVHGSGMTRSEVIEDQFEEFTTNHNMESLYSEMIKGYPQVSSKIGIDSSPVAATLTGELPSISAPDKCSDVGKILELTSCEAYSNSVPCDVACEKGKGVGIQRQHSQHDRLHWDLNVVMDVWEQRSDCSVAQTSDFESGDTLNDGRSMKTIGNLDQIVKPEILKFINMKQSVSEPEQPVDHGLRHNRGDFGITGDEQKPPLDIYQSSLSMPSSCENNVPLDHKGHLNGDHVAKSLNLDGAPSDSTDLKFELDETCSVAAEDTTGESGFNDAESSLKGSSCANFMGRSIVGETSTDRCRVKVEHAAKSLNSVRVPSDSADLKNLSFPSSHETCSVKAEGITSTKCAGGSTFSAAEMSLTGLSRPVILRQGLTGGTNRNECIDKKVCSEEGRDDLAFPISQGCDDRIDIVDTKLESGCKIYAVPDTDIIEAKTELAARSSITETTNSSGTTSSSSRSLRINYVEFLKLSDKRKMLDTFDQKSNIDLPSEHYSSRGFESEGEPLDGYDSQYEDGELREPSGHGWEEYEALDGEAEHVGYRPSSMHIRNSYDTDDCLDKVASPLVSQIDSELTAVDNRQMMQNTVEDNLISQKSEDEGRRSMAPDELPGDDRDSSAIEVSGRDNCERVRIYSRAGRLTDSDDTENNARSRRLSRVLSSQIDGSVSRDVSFKQEHMGGTGSRWERESGHRSRLLRRPRFFMQDQAKTGQVDGCVDYLDGQRGFEQHYSSTYHARANSDTASVMEGKDVTMNGASYRSQPLNDNFAADGDQCNEFQPGNFPNEDLNSNRPMGRGWFLRYGLKMGHRVDRGRYRGPYSDDYQTSMKYRRPLCQRERTDSSGASRRECALNHQTSHRRSPSRTATRSPDFIASLKGRFGPGNYQDTFLRDRSRSPNFRSDCRMMTRSPNSQAGFLTDRARFRPPRREQLWICDRKDEAGDFRDLCYKHRDSMLDRSPGRERLRGVFDGASNSRPDVFFRSPPAGLSEVEGPTRRFRADEYYENRRKQFGPPYSSERGLEHGNARRLRHTDDNVDRNFVPSYRNAAEFRGRGMRNVDNRTEDMTRRFSRDQRFIYEQDGKLDADLKSFRFNRMDRSRNMKSGAHHRSYRPGRLGEMDGAGRGNRYMENYEDRREDHGPGLSHPFRRDELENTVMRLDPGVDDDTVREDYTCSQDVIDSLSNNAKRKQFGPPYSSERGLEHGNARRLWHTDDNVDRNFVPSYRNAAEFRGRGMRNVDNRTEDMTRRFLREQRFIYEQDGELNADLKSFRFNMMDPSRNMKSGAHHKSYRPGRLGEMDGAGRGNRYMENYEDRRERHGPGLSHPFRRDEMESTVMRLDTRVDDDTVRKDYTCSQDVIDSLGNDAKGIDHLERDLLIRCNKKELDMPVQDGELEDEDVDKGEYLS